MSSESRLELACKQIEFARNYTLSLLEDLSNEEWFWHPEPAVTHIAWQVGHLAMAQYGLTLFRQRGRQPMDTELMSSRFRKRFSRGSNPDPDPTNYPTPQEIREVLDKVHQQMLVELPHYPDSQLDEEIEPPHAVYSTKYGALLFAADHEMLHAGQIGLLRRLLGKDPIR